MANNIRLIAFPVKDLDKAKIFYSAFSGTKPYVDTAYYVGYKVGDVEIGLDPNSAGGPIVYTDTDDIKATLAAMTQSGAEIIKDASDVGGGMLIAQVKDASGNVVGFRQHP